MFKCLDGGSIYCCWLLAAGCCCWPLLLARLRGVGLPCGAVGMGPRAVRLEALVLAKLVRRRLPDDLHGRVENLERALEHAPRCGRRGGGVQGHGCRRGAGGWMSMMEMYGLWLHAYSSQGSAASLGWASSSSSVRLYDCQYWPVMPVELQIDLV